MKILFAVSLPIDELKKIGENVQELKTNRMHFLFSLIYYFWKNNHEIVIVSSDRTIDKDIVYEQENLKIYIVKLWKHGRISAADNFKIDVLRLKKVIGKEQCDVYNAHWSYEYAEACLEVDAERTIITVHDWPDAVCPAIGNYFWKKRNVLGNKVIKRGKVFTAVSPYIKRNIKSANKKAEIFLTPDFLCEEELQILAKKGEKGEKNFIIMCVNNGFNEIKNTQKAMEAFHKFHKKNPMSSMNMYGDGYELGGKAYTWAEDRGLLEGITFNGRVDRREIISAFQKADVLLHTSREESFGLVYLEAMASETLIIAGKNSGATPWVLDEGKAGILADVDDTENIYNTLKSIGNNKEKKEELISNGLERVKKNFLFRSVVESYQECYIKVCESSINNDRKRRRNAECNKKYNKNQFT